MAKLAFSKLKLKEKEDIKIAPVNETESIEVKQYLPINDKLDLIGNVISLAYDGNNFVNPVKLQMFMDLEVVFRYTNISFTDKQKEDIVKLYDILSSNNIFNLVYEAIPEDEIEIITDGIFDTAEGFYAAQNSALGIVEQIVKEYDNLDGAADGLRQKIIDSGAADLLKGVADKLV